ncbi:acyl-CoA thioesterase [Luteolibacter pohnpeiensis]|uniref:Acyl-CoA thioesterase n=1 Tax=Luteolibacter pohnpeiensis TaxID=454153 RepID=A0A934S248_9BACT|nr:thioesterase family protein [Luteolibacter pohnpeiensis]MBK1881800.1 acyl-CoA thioesterase [Luteolibacter pohnpeiensis]
MENPLHRQAFEVAFGDTDASGWMHFPKIFTYVEAAEHAYLRSRGVLVFARDQGGWPRVKVECDYKRPFLSGDPLEVQLRIARIGGASLTWEFEVYNAAQELAAVGSIVSVRVNHLGRPQEISAEERAALLPS